MLAVLGGLADVERDLIRTRTAEGRSRAKARGQAMGRPPSLTQQEEATRRRAQGATLHSIRRSLDRLTPACSAISLWGASGFAPLRLDHRRFLCCRQQATAIVSRPAVNSIPARCATRHTLSRG
jgi:hypothetical protein